MKKIPRVKPGQPIRTRSVNGLVDAATEASHISVGPPLTLRDGPDGPRLSREPDDGFWARLTGNSGDAYSYQEVTWFNGATVDVTGGRTGTTSTRPAYEVNGITSLPVGWIDFLRPGAPGEYVFQSVRYGSSGCGSGTRTINAIGCGVNQVGATVSVTGPSGFTASGTTDSSGNYTFGYTGYPAGTYNYSVNGGSRFNVATGSMSLTCGGSGTTTVGLTAATGFICAGCCTNPIPLTLSLTTPFGSAITLTHNPSFGWRGTSVESITCSDSSGAAVTGNVTFTWTMDNSLSCGLTGTWPNGFCNNRPLCDGATSPGTCTGIQWLNIASSSPGTTSCLPYSQTYTFIEQAGNTFIGTATITE